MRFPLCILALATLNFMPADSARAGSDATYPVAEIVTFHLNSDVTQDAFLNAARATDSIVRAAPGFISRQLSKGEDGRWTDYILWQSMQDAKAAAQTVIKQPEFAAFGQAIDFESIVMRHELVKWQMQQ